MKHAIFPKFKAKSPIFKCLKAFLLTVIMSFLVGLMMLPDQASAHSYSHYADARERYQVAMNQLATGQLDAFRQNLEALSDYPLYPYLEYERINQHITRLPVQDVQAFIERYKGTPVANKMNRRWLNVLIKKHQWQQYVDDWDPAIRNTRLRCWHLRAKYRTGNKTEALAGVQALWLKPHSQPKACDPLFKEWITGGYLSQDVAWQRLSMAMAAHRTRLAGYIVRKLLKDDYALLGQAYLNAHRRPEALLTNAQSLQQLSHSDKANQIILHGLKRWLRKDLAAASQAWVALQADFAFASSETQEINQLITMAASSESALAGLIEQDEKIIGDAAKTIEGHIRAALRGADWPKVASLIRALPAPYQQKSRWQYWLARSLEEQKLDEPGLPEPQQIYQELAKTRNFYGFLAADLIDAEYAMRDQPAPVDPMALHHLAENPNVVRALELFAVNQLTDARREWSAGSRDMDGAALVALGKMAESFDWHEKAIRSLIHAQYWDDLQTRFPLAYKHKILDASQSKQLDASWLYAIARQESAFSPDAKSSAGALGLMQLMPGTAKDSARELGLKVRKADLLQPETNIELGSNYLKTLLKKFEGNRILATTAYNAGPHRVKKWLETTQNNLPFDAWIETIPFRETRSYVQNVLAFSVIYDYRLNRYRQLVTSQEAEQLL